MFDKVLVKVLVTTTTKVKVLKHSYMFSFIKK